MFYFGIALRPIDEFTSYTQIAVRDPLLYCPSECLSLFNFLIVRNRIRMYPAFVNCTTIDWFTEWPQDALLEVAEKYLDSMDLGDEEVRDNGPVTLTF